MTVQGDAVHCIFGFKDANIRGEFQCTISNEAAIAIIMGIVFVVLSCTCFCCFKVYEGQGDMRACNCICCSGGYSAVPKEECYEMDYK